MNCQLHPALTLGFFSEHNIAHPHHFAVLGDRTERGGASPEERDPSIIPPA